MIAATSFLLLIPAVVGTVTIVDPVLAQDVDDDDDDNGAPVGGVEAGAGGAYDGGQNTLLPIAATGGLALAGAGVIGYRRFRKQQR